LSSILSVVSAIFWEFSSFRCSSSFTRAGIIWLRVRFTWRVTEFFLGMPCRVRLSHKSEKYGTEVGVTPILLGGYTRICGMEGDDNPLLAPALGSVTRRGRASVRGGGRRHRLHPR